MGGLGNGDWLEFSNVDFGAGPFQAYLRAAGGSGGSGLVRFRVDSPTGPVLGDLAIGNTGGWNNYVTLPTNAGGTTGVHNLFVTFESGYPGDYVNVDRLQFGKIGQAAPDLASAPEVVVFAGSLAAVAATPVVKAAAPAKPKACPVAKKSKKSKVAAKKCAAKNAHK